jgi:hypothetical protein
MKPETSSVDEFTAKIAKLEQRRDLLDEECIDLTHQIELAKSEAYLSNVYADSEWFNKARQALRVKRKRFNEFLRQLGELRREVKRKRYHDSAANFERVFVKMAKRRLSEHTLQTLVDATWEEMHIQGIVNTAKSRAEQEEYDINDPEFEYDDDTEKDELRPTTPTARLTFVATKMKQQLAKHIWDLYSMTAVNRTKIGITGKKLQKWARKVEEMAAEIEAISRTLTPAEPTAGCRPDPSVA